MCASDRWYVHVALLEMSAIQDFMKKKLNITKDK